jgi:hypothetical protein
LTNKHVHVALNSAASASHSVFPLLFFYLQFEVARCRPQLTPEFFKQLDTLVGQERFSPKPDEVRGKSASPV